MCEWLNNHLGEIFTVSSGTGLSSSKMEHGPFPVFGGNGIMGYHSSYNVDQPTLIIGRVGEHCGNVYHLKNKVWVTDNALLVSFLKKGHHLQYWYYHLNFLNLNSFAFSAAQPVITGGILKKITTKYPPLPIQRKIARILSTVDRQIEHTEALIRKYEMAKQGLMQDLFTRGIDPATGKLRLRYEDAPELYWESELGWVPRGWEVKPISELAAKVTDGDHHTPIRTQSGYYLLSARNVNDGYIDVSDVDYVGEVEYQRMRKRCDPEPGDILISCSGTVGRVCEVPEGFECVLVRSAALVKFRPEEVISRYAEWIMRSDLVKRQIVSRQRQGAQANLFQGEIALLQLLQPSQKEQKLIAEKLDSLEKLIEREALIMQQSRILKQGLMQDLLTGRVPVNP